MTRRNRKQKQLEYDIKYQGIPINYLERLSWMCDKYNLSEKKMDEIINKRDDMIMSLCYKEITIILFEEPEGSPRPRFRLVNRQNLINEAITNSNFVHVYMPNAHEDNVFMQRMSESELYQLDGLLCTPCIVEYSTFFKTPSSFSITDTFLAECGLFTQLNKPDWDNIGKKYSDMSNQNIWLDDAFVVDGIVHKRYSMLPRIEIKINFLNMVYNKYQYNAIVKRKDYNESYGLKYFGMEENKNDK
ncbi:MAG: RusA family crossover junction endodeoxyribonuclease [Bacilli bacterium]|nr:RusA family crossover junction endodeoxyribonuclease [Bacilli bacterium]